METEIEYSRFGKLLSSTGVGEGNIWDTVLDETENFICVPTKGSLVVGWVLIIPKRPFLSLAELNLPLRIELQNFVKKISSVLTEKFGPITIFENGPDVKGSLVGCGMDHAHLHIVPLKFDLCDKALEKSAEIDAKWKPYDNGQPLDHVSENCAYIYIQNASGKFIVSQNFVPQSQFLRRIIAQNLFVPNKWDYSEHPYVDNIAVTINMMA